MNVYGHNAWAPSNWDIKRAANGNRQRFTVVAASSVAAALRAFAEVGVNVTRSEWKTYGYSGVGGEAAEVALSQPGTVFYQQDDLRGVYVPAPTTTKRGTP